MSNPLSNELIEYSILFSVLRCNKSNCSCNSIQAITINRVRWQRIFLKRYPWSQPHFSLLNHDIRRAVYNVSKKNKNCQTANECTARRYIMAMCTAVIHFRHTHVDPPYRPICSRRPGNAWHCVCTYVRALGHRRTIGERATRVSIVYIVTAAAGGAPCIIIRTPRRTHLVGNESITNNRRSHWK